MKDGCIELTFRYFDNTIAKLFPLGEAEKAALIKIGVQRLCCGKKEVVLMKAALTCDHTQPSSSAPVNTPTGNHTQLPSTPMEDHTQPPSRFSALETPTGDHT